MYVLNSVSFLSTINVRYIFDEVKSGLSEICMSKYNLLSYKKKEIFSHESNDDFLQSKRLLRDDLHKFSKQPFRR